MLSLLYRRAEFLSVIFLASMPTTNERTDERHLSVLVFPFDVSAALSVGSGANTPIKMVVSNRPLGYTFFFPQ